MLMSLGLDIVDIHESIAIETTKEIGCHDMRAAEQGNSRGRGVAGAGEQQEHCMVTICLEWFEKAYLALNKIEHE
jgi:hypothetical protein